jgi:hypothetical protein
MGEKASTLYIWLSRAGSVVGIACMAIALVSSVADITLIVDPNNYVQVAIAAFLFAIWSALAAKFKNV